MLKKLLVVSAFLSLGAIVISSNTPLSPTQDALLAFKNNNCVECHSHSRGDLKLANHYADWHMSLHKEKGIGCEKCHGGDPAIKEQAKAHTGVLPLSNPASSLHPKNLAQTCGSCHREIANAFVESKHYQNLKTAGLGPSCSTCHGHMASEVIYTPEETSKLCASCHDSTNALLPKRPEIPGKADETMQALKRANFVTLWADRLLEDAHTKKVDTTDETKDMKVVRAMLAESKITWHVFNLETARRKADAAFEEGTKVKDALRKKLYPNT